MGQFLMVDTWDYQWIDTWANIGVHEWIQSVGYFHGEEWKLDGIFIEIQWDGF